MLGQLAPVVDEIRSAWRFHRHGLVAMWVVAVVAWSGAFAVPSKYESTARIFLDANALLKPLLEGLAVTSDSASQIELVRRVLLARPQLETVVDSTDLRLRYHGDRERAELVKSLMKDIRITAAASTPNAREANIFSISYADRDAKLAYSVVSMLLDRLVSQSLGENRLNSDTAQRFLHEQIVDYETRLSQSEARLAAFKKNNVGAMPDQRGDYFARLQSEMTALDQAQSTLNVAVKKRDTLRGKLLGGATDASGGAATSGQVMETSVDSRLREATAKLEDLLVRFTDAHPDVIAMRETIDRLQQQRNEELATLRNNVGSLGSPRGGSSLVAQNLQIALNQAELDMATLQSQVADHSRRVAELRQRMNTLPEVEAELSKLTRDYDVTKAEYEKLLQRFESAKLSDAADRIDSVRFRVVDPPVPELTPRDRKSTRLNSSHHAISRMPSSA